MKMLSFDSDTLKPKDNSKFAKFLSGKVQDVKFYKDDKKAVVLYHSPYQLVIYDLVLDLLEFQNPLVSSKLSKASASPKVSLHLI